MSEGECRLGPRYYIDFNTARLPVEKTDVIVIGAGIAGLYTALKASEQGQVVMITKTSLTESNTRYAQGGIAAVISATDSPALHRQDTLLAGVGLCEEEAVNVLVHEGPCRVHDLIQMGTQFDLEDGELSLTQEGAHSQRRILHAHGDATGAEIVRALSERVLENDGIEVWDNHFALDLLIEDEYCQGVLVQKPDGKRVVLVGKATVLCTGGAGQLYRYTTNPDIATADGIALAYRAGAIIRDLEFVQFHPTALVYPGAPRFLLTEALRGEGAILRNLQGKQFMHKYHPQAELAPRDVVARAIVTEMELTNAPYVYLDITHEDSESIKQRFPTVYQLCISFGLDLTSDWVPVAPAAHYMMGGVVTNLDGETAVKGLYACGEVSSTGVHGANRLASNSLSEAIVFSGRIVQHIRSHDREAVVPQIEYNLNRSKPPMQAVIEKRLKLQKIMVRYAGLKRNANGLQKACEELERHLNLFDSALSKQEEFEFGNLLTTALLSVRAAKIREESRGAHYREDFPEMDDLIWGHHIQFQRKEGKGGIDDDRLEQ